MDEVETEFRAQVQRFREAGLTATHLDTHKHIHCLPGILRVLIRVAVEAQIDKVRLPVEARLGSASATVAVPWKARTKRDLIRFLCRNGRQQLLAGGMRATDAFVGIGYQDLLNSEVLGFILHHVGPGVTEIMCHPGHADPAARVFSRRPPDRERELQALTDPRTRAVVEANQIELVSYRDAW